MRPALLRLTFGLALAAQAGCSTAPLADILDATHRAKDDAPDGDRPPDRPRGEPTLGEPKPPSMLPGGR